MSEADINAISHGTPPSASQQALGEGCFNQYAKDKGYAQPLLTPPDPSQPFDPNSKQNQCADLVAQGHGIRFNQINPSIVAKWNAADLGKLNSCYGVAAAASATGGLPFAPASPQIAVSATKLNCIKQIVGDTKLAAVMAGTASISEVDKLNVYNKCVNLTTTAAGANPALVGVLAALPPSDLESQFIPVDSSKVSTPSADGSKIGADGSLEMSGEVDVAPGADLPTKVDTFVKSTTNTFSVPVKQVSATKGVWTVKIAQNKLPFGTHRVYSVATLADASRVRSPDATFAIAKAIKSHLTKTVAWLVAGLGVLAGIFYGWKWHQKRPAKAKI